MSYHKIASRDQAQGLREKNHKPIKVIAVTAGKGGVGKSTLSVNLAAALAQSGERTLLFDADLSLANIDVMLGLKPQYDIANVLHGDCHINDIILTGPANIKVIPATSGVQSMANLDQKAHAGIINVFSEINDDFDTLIVDTAAGISSSVVSYLLAAHEIIVVACDEPSSITDAYALIKTMSRDYQINKFHLVCNMVKGPEHAKQLFLKLDKVCEHFLDVHLNYFGFLPFDELVRKTIKHQKLVYLAYSNSPASREIKKICQRIQDFRDPLILSGHLEFFMERILAGAVVNH